MFVGECRQAPGNDIHNLVFHAVLQSLHYELSCSYQHLQTVEWYTTVKIGMVAGKMLGVRENQDSRMRN